MKAIDSIPLTASHTLSRVLHAYADWRIGATPAEKRAYNPTDGILFTFDDYGSERQVHETLRILKEKNVKAAFFLQGSWALKNPELVDSIRSAGHIVGNHTYNHRVLMGIPDQDIRDEISNGIEAPWFRPPQGRYNNHIRAIAKSLGYAICYWTIDSQDWTGASVKAMRHTIVNELTPGAAILFHLNGEHTLELLPSIIDEIRERGYELVSPKTPAWRP